MTWVVIKTFSHEFETFNQFSQLPRPYGPEKRVLAKRKQRNKSTTTAVIDKWTPAIDRWHQIDHKIKFPAPLDRRRMLGTLPTKLAHCNNAITNTHAMLVRLECGSPTGLIIQESPT